jgi:hypothetical protein
VLAGGDRLLLSDQRTARWVLLGRDHIDEFERRCQALRDAETSGPAPSPPTFVLKGITVHFQSAFSLMTALTGFAQNGTVTGFEEVTPTYSIGVSASTEGLELRDSENSVILTRREARKWANLMQNELKRLNARQVDRGQIRTVFIDDGARTWILQWGDEVYVMSAGEIARGFESADPSSKRPRTSERIGELSLILHPGSGACVALTEPEIHYLDHLPGWMDEAAG